MLLLFVNFIKLKKLSKKWTFVFFEIYPDTQILSEVRKNMLDGYHVCVEYIRGRFACGYERAKRLRSILVKEFEEKNMPLPTRKLPLGKWTILL